MEAGNSHLFVTLPRINPDYTAFSAVSAGFAPVVRAPREIPFKKQH
jgi:hypothetical protein